MSVKIISGLLKGMLIEIPGTCSIRPTSIMLRKKLFDIFQHLDEVTFIDAAAGSGSVGLEALSHGAEKVIFIEKDRENFKILKKNVDRALESLKKQGHQPMVEIFMADALLQLPKFKFNADKKVVLFFDPPYESVDLYRNFSDLVHRLSWKSEVWIEACNKKTLPSEEMKALFPSYRLITHSDHYIILASYV
jgi:16S rRNA (guanine966-N2)-methyltransferase